MEKRKIEGKKDGNNCQDKKGFVVDGRQEALGNQYENNKGEQNLWIKPYDRPVKKHRKPDENRG